jgi:enoyl-CoA hydratase/carnithine racemase
MTHETTRCDVDGSIAFTTLNGPEEIESAVNGAVADSSERIIVVRGAGRSFGIRVSSG